MPVMNDPLVSYRLFEEAVEKHARLLGEARNLLSKIRRNPGSLEYQEKLLRVFRLFRIVRARLEKQGKQLTSINNALTGDAATLLEYMVLVGLEEELDLLSKAISLSAKMDVLSKEVEALGRDREDVSRLLKTLTMVFDSLPQNSNNSPSH